MTRASHTARTDDRPMLGAALMADTAAFMQLARPEVGYGVIESPVESGSVFRHPYKRTRTTLTYLVVAMRGIEDTHEASSASSTTPRATSSTTSSSCASRTRHCGR